MTDNRTPSREAAYKLKIRRREDYSGEHREWDEEYELPQALVQEIQSAAVLQAEQQIERWRTVGRNGMEATQAIGDEWERRALAAEAALADRQTTPGAGVEDELASYEKFDGIGPHSETIETRARIGERYLEAYESALSDPRLKGYTPADCPSELLLDVLNTWSPPVDESSQVAGEAQRPTAWIIYKDGKFEDFGRADITDADRKAGYSSEPLYTHLALSKPQPTPADSTAGDEARAGVRDNETSREAVRLYQSFCDNPKTAWSLPLWASPGHRAITAALKSRDDLAARLAAERDHFRTQFQRYFHEAADAQDALEQAKGVLQRIGSAQVAFNAHPVGVIETMRDWANEALASLGNRSDGVGK